MIQIFAYSCLLSALLSVVEMKHLNIKGHVGENVTFKCSNWNTWTSVKSNNKYFCKSPCSEDKHIIRAAFGKTTHEKRITLTNTAEALSVTFTHLQKSDSNTYYCGVDRTGLDAFIRVNLNVIDAESYSTKKTPKTFTVVPTLSSAVTNSFTISSNGSDIITDILTLYTPTPTASATQGAGSLPYLIIGVILIITILMVLLKLMSKMKQQKVVLSAFTPQEGPCEEVEYDEIRHEVQTDSECLYANYCSHQDTGLAAKNGKSFSEEVSLHSAIRFEASSRGVCAEIRDDLVYSVAQLPKEQPNPSESNGNDSLYSLAQQPHAL
ncbi:CMRF35-like molecule 3 [Cottoperca gobio]|uniref:CMRF35-like molecule 3 n=1 Tax=Cottoperca gobio TaxID=56716 RepID=A0A6J2Q6K4_COTGO|nr:CMRF35-like molecule 3 [Cottoperca gobio]